MDPSRIGFRPLTREDLPLMHRWLNTDFVIQWWDPRGRTWDEVVEKYTGYIEGQKPTRPFVIMYGDVPTGYIQTYRIADWPDYARAVGVEEAAAGLDLFIGHPDYIRRGLGAHILARFLRDIVFADPDVVSCIVGPEPKNTGAIRAYEKSGFRHLKTVRVPGEPEPEFLMRVGRDEVTAPNGPGSNRR